MFIQARWIQGSRDREGSGQHGMAARRVLESAEAGQDHPLNVAVPSIPRALRAEVPFPRFPTLYSRGIELLPGIFASEVGSILKIRSPCSRNREDIWWPITISLFRLCNQDPIPCAQGMKYDHWLMVFQRSGVFARQLRWPRAVSGQRSLLCGPRSKCLMNGELLWMCWTEPRHVVSMSDSSFGDPIEKPKI